MRVSPVLFSVLTPLGFSVRTTEAYWGFVERNHPEVRGKIDIVKRSLEAPYMIRRSKQDRSVYLFYAHMPPYHLVVVAKRLDGEGFIKEGELAWPTFG